MISDSTKPVMTSNATTVPLTTVPLCDSSDSLTRSPASSRKSSMSWREMSNGLSSTSQSSRSSTDVLEGGAQVGELVDDGGHQHRHDARQHEQEPDQRDGRHQRGRPAERRRRWPPGRAPAPAAPPPPRPGPAPTALTAAGAPPNPRCRCRSAARRRPRPAPRPGGPACGRGGRRPAATMSCSMSGTIPPSPRHRRRVAPPGC